MSYEITYADFRWEVPAEFNIGVDCCDRWAATEPERVAIIDAAGTTTRFGELRAHSNRIASHLRSLGIAVGDRVGVLAPQRVETASAHLAIYKSGAIAVPLFALFGPDALRHRLGDSGARVLLTDREGEAKVAALRADLPALEQVVSFDDPEWEGALAEASPDFTPLVTGPDDPALIIYTSGTTGSSKGALLPHRVLLGHLPGVEMSHGGFPRPGDRMWTPADWAWIGGLLDVLLPALHHGVAVVAHRFPKFDAEAAFALIAQCGVRNTFLPPTALKMLRAAPPPPKGTVNLRSIASGGESLGAELLGWGREVLGVEINEFYGQTECNMVLSSCAPWFAAKPGSIGKAAPGHIVGIVDGDGNPVPNGTEGEIAVKSPDAVMFLRYWNLPEKTAEKFAGRWLLTGDQGVLDDDGFIRFVGRADDVITSAGYRIGPGEIEDCLLRHPAVRSVGVVGIPDPTRTESVTAFVVTEDGTGTPELAKELQDVVRSRLGAHQYPRKVHFVASLPITATGKILRRELRILGEELARQAE